MITQVLTGLLRRPTGEVLERFAAGGSRLVLVGVAIVQSELLHPLVGVVGLVLAPLFVLGSLEFVGPFEPRGWRLAGTIVPLAYLGWSVWLLAVGVGQSGRRLTHGTACRRSDA